jgi:nicotinate-nucleotide pyrophosphorylase (carboxylating)
MLPELLEFLKEDIGDGDITTDATVPEDLEASAEVAAREDGVLAGLEEVAQLLEHEGLKHKTSFKDGDEIKKGSVLMEVRGNARKILGVERLILNILTRMSGIATLAKSLAKKAEPYGVTIAGTRKTTPGFRYFEKRAIEIGGGHPHRLGLDDAFLIKDNHIAVAGLEDAIKRVKKSGISKTVEVEVSTTEDALCACRLGADIIMLDNVEPDAIEKTINEIEKEGLRSRVKIELSGGITPGNLEQFIRLRPDVISIGALTTNAKWLDMSMSIKIDDR